MKVIVKENRQLVIKNPENTQNENDVEEIVFQFPEKYQDWNKKIVFLFLDSEKIYWDLIQNDRYTLQRNVTTHKEVKFYVWLTNGTKDFRSAIEVLPFNDNVDASDEITPEEIGAVNKILEEVDKAIEETNNLDLDVTKEDNTVTIKVTKKDGTTKGETLKDGKDGKDGIDGKDGVGLDYDWNNTSLGVKREDETDYQYVDLKGDKGEAGQDGISPTATVSKSGKTVTITITDKNGTTTTQIQDGEDGTDGQDGYTPQKGVDYWTDEEIEEVATQIEGKIERNDIFFEEV